MITEDYVSFEVAKLLKEKGFNEDSWFHYDTDGDIVTRGYRLNHPDDIPAWTIQMVMKWLREEKHIFIDIYYDEDIKGYLYSIIKLVKGTILNVSDLAYNTYEEACEAAIKYCLTNLI